MLVFALGWGIALLLFFPIAWMVLTSFKSEVAAIAVPPHVLFTPTLDSYVEVQARADYLHFAMNSLVVSLGGTLLALLFAIPAAYAMAFHPTERTRGTLLWMLSTKMLPPVGVLVPIYLLFRTAGPAGHPQRPGHDLRADEPAHRGLDAVHLLQGGAERDPGGRAHGRRADLAASSGSCCCR